MFEGAVSATLAMSSPTRLPGNELHLSVEADDSVAETYCMTLSDLVGKT